MPTNVEKGLFPSLDILNRKKCHLFYVNLIGKFDFIIITMFY